MADRARGRIRGAGATLGAPPCRVADYASFMSAFPVTRLRRLRRTGALRSLVRETRLDLDDFVMPLFVGPQTEPNDALPAMGRWSVDEVGEEVDRLAAAGVKAVLLF